MKITHKGNTNHLFTSYDSHSLPVTDVVTESAATARIDTDARCWSCL